MTIQEKIEEELIKHIDPHAAQVELRKAIALVCDALGDDTFDQHIKTNISKWVGLPELTTEESEREEAVQREMRVLIAADKILAKQQALIDKADEIVAAMGVDLVAAAKEETNG